MLLPKTEEYPNVSVREVTVFEAPKPARLVSTNVRPGLVPWKGFWPYFTVMVSLPPRSNWSTRRVQMSALDALEAVFVRDPLSELGEPSDLKIAMSVGSLIPAAFPGGQADAIGEPPAPPLLSTFPPPSKNVLFFVDGPPKHS